MGGRGDGGTRGIMNNPLRSALNAWGKNASQIRLASIGENKPDGFRYTEFNRQQDNARAKQIEDFVDNHSVRGTIYRGISNLSDKDYVQYTTPNAIINQRGLSSWTTDKRIATGYGQYKNGIVFVQKGSGNARRLGNLAGTNTEREVIVGSKARQRVIKVEKRNGITYVYTQDERRKRR